MASSPRALIADPFVPTSGAIRRHLESVGFDVTAVHYLDEAVQQVKSDSPDLLFAAVSPTFDGETLCLKAKELAPYLPVVLVYPPEEEAADEHARNSGADAFLVGPLKRAMVVSCARTMLRIQQLQAAVQKLEAENDKLVAARLKPGPAPAAAAAPAASAPHAAVPTGDRDFEFFKRLLLMEVKRSRRYRYPVSFLLVELDKWSERSAGMSAQARMQALAEALDAVASGLRDIDLAMPSSKDRLLIFLPHTPRDGALVVADRLRARIAKMKVFKDATASVGIASFAGGQTKAQISFGTLMKDASEALRKAQAAGGDRSEAAGQGKRERISMG